MENDFEKNVEAAAELRDSKKKKKSGGRKKKAELLVIPAQVPPPLHGEIIPPKAEPKLFDLGKMLSDVEQLKLLDGDKVRELLEKQLNLMSLNANQAAIETLKGLAVNENEEMKSELSKRLATQGMFTDSISRQRLALAKAEFMPTVNGVPIKRELADFTECSDEELRQKYGKSPSNIPN